jgi:hypothetical protein
LGARDHHLDKTEILKLLARVMQNCDSVAPMTIKRVDHPFSGCDHVLLVATL